MDTRRVFKTPTNNSYASDYIKNKRSKVIFSGTSDLASTIVEQGGAFPLVTPSGHLKPYQGTFGFSSATPTQGAPPSSYCLNTARSYSDLLSITKGKYLLTPPNLTTTTVTQLNDINFSPQLFCGNLYEKGKTGVNESIIFNSSITGVTGATGATGAANKIIYNPATTANQWIKVDPSYNMLHNGSSCESEKSHVLTDVVIRPNINAQRKLDRYLNLDVQGFKFPVKFSLNYQPEDCINANNDIQTVNNELSFIPSFLTRTVADAPYPISSFVNFNSPVPIIYSSSNPAVATVSGTTVTIVGVVGSTTITASQAASDDGIYPSSVATTRLDVTLIPLRLNEFSIDSRDFGTVPFTLTPPTSNSSGAFTYTSSRPEVATVTSTTGVVTIVGAGTTVITATQAAAGNYAAGSTPATFIVNPIAPTLNNFSIPYKDFGTAPFTLTPPTTNSSGAFSYTSDNTAVATIVGDVVTIVGASYSKINVTQAAAGNYTESLPLYYIFRVNKIAPNLTNFSIPAKDHGTLPFELTPPTTNSSGAFTYTSSQEDVATIVGNVVTIVGAGTTVIRATQVATTNYISKYIEASFVVRQILPRLGNFTDVSVKFNSGAFTLTPPSTPSDGRFTYTSSDLGVATVGSATGVVTILNVGTTVITALQDASGNFASNTTTGRITVEPALPDFGPFEDLSKSLGQAPFTLTPPTTNSSGAFTYTSSNTAVATVGSTTGLVTILAGGSTTITATQAASGNFKTRSVSAVFVVTSLRLAANNVTVQYDGINIDTIETIPLFVQYNLRNTGMEWFAIVDDRSLPEITNYALTLQSQYFTPSGQTTPVPFNNIVTTLMTNMSFMFSSATTFNSAIDSWDTSRVTNMRGMFISASAFNNNGNSSMGNWNTSQVTNMSVMFQRATSFNQPIGNWNTSNVESMESMFQNATIFNQPIGSWNTSKVTTMSTMFTRSTAFNQNIGAWDTSRVTSMRGMFLSATSFNQPIGNWNTSAVTDMISMFTSTRAFNQNIGAWNTGNVTSMSGMFNGALVFNNNGNSSIGNWDTSRVRDMSWMFTTAFVFDQNIGKWNTSAVTNMRSMFQDAFIFNQPIYTNSMGNGGWNTSNVTNMSAMFISVRLFNQPIGNWNTSAVTDMSHMFNSSRIFNKNISEWTVAQVRFFDGFRTNSVLSTENTPPRFR
jgi:surface protein